MGDIAGITSMKLSFDRWICEQNEFYDGEFHVLLLHLTYNMPILWVCPHMEKTSISFCQPWPL